MSESNPQPSVLLPTASCSKPNPLYCAVCAAPCLFPLITCPPPTDTYTYGKIQEDKITSTTSSFPSVLQLDAQGWLYRWHILRVCEGIVPIPDLSCTFYLKNQPAHKREISIHDYCLEAVHTIVRPDSYGRPELKASMLNKSGLPNRTGLGPWIAGVLTDGRQDGYWKGTKSQQDRWNGDPGSQLLPTDLISPLDVGHPTPSSAQVVPSTSSWRRRLKDFAKYDTQPVAKQSKSQLESLPITILHNIISHLLNIGVQSQDSKEHNAVPIPLIPRSSFSDFSSLLSTSRTLRYLDLPSFLWKKITVDLVHHYRLLLVSRWEENPTSVGSASRLLAALDVNFYGPVNTAFENSHIHESQSSILSTATKSVSVLDKDTNEASAKDIYQWWMYDERWRSRRRVWYCVVFGCDADWL